MLVHRRCCPIFIIAVVSVGCSAIIVTPRCSIPLLSPSSRRETIITSRKNSSVIYYSVNKNNDVELSVSLPRRRRRFDNSLFVTRWGGSNDDEKLGTFLQLKYKTLADAKPILGDLKTIRNNFIEYQKYLYT